MRHHHSLFGAACALAAVATLASAASFAAGEDEAAGAALYRERCANCHATGKIVWDIDTKRPYTTVNGVPAQGGSLDGPGAVVVDGMLYVNSGYGIFGGVPGNVLLAFSVDGK